MSADTSQAVESYKQLAEEVEKEMKNPPFRVDATTLTMFADFGKMQWPINPKGHVNPARKTILKLIDNYKQTMEAKIADGESRSEMEEYSTGIDKQILELGLVDFDYDKEAANEKLGPVMLQLMSQELQIFLVENGGKTGMQYLQTLQKLDTLNRYNSFQNSTKSSQSSTDSP